MVTRPHSRAGLIACLALAVSCAGSGSTSGSMDGAASQMACAGSPLRVSMPYAPLAGCEAAGTLGCWLQYQYLPSAPVSFTEQTAAAAIAADGGASIGSGAPGVQWQPPALLQWYTLPASADVPTPRMASKLRCAGGSLTPACDVALSTVTKPNATAYVAVFSADTDMPEDALSPQGLAAYFVFGGAGWGAPVAGEWEAPNRLVFTMTLPPEEDAGGDEAVAAPAAEPQYLDLKKEMLLPTVALSRNTRALRPRQLRRGAAPWALLQAGSAAANDSTSATVAGGTVQLLPLAGGTLKFTACAVTLGGVSRGGDEGGAAACATALRCHALSAAAQSASATAALGLSTEEAARCRSSHLALADACPCARVLAEAETTVAPRCPGEEDEDEDEGGNSQALLTPGGRLLPLASIETTASGAISSPSTAKPSSAAAAANGSLAGSPFTRFPGVLTTGIKGIRLPPGSLPPGANPPGGASSSSSTSAEGPAAATGWGWSAWVWLWAGAGEDATLAGSRGPGLDGTAPPAVSSGSSLQPNYRTFFFKGHGGSDQHRTPSAWLLPDSNRLLLRVSKHSLTDAADVEWDSGAVSVGSLPVRRWTHVAFVFNNASHAYLSGAGNGSLSPAAAGLPPPTSTYSYKLYLNGHLDTAMSFSYPGLVTANDGPLYIGKQDSFPGATALWARLALWQGGLTDADVAAEYTATAALFQPSPTVSTGEGGGLAGNLTSAVLGAAGRAASSGSDASVVSLEEATLLTGVMRATTVASLTGPPLWVPSSSSSASVLEAARAAARARIAAAAAAATASDVSRLPPADVCLLKASGWLSSGSTAALSSLLASSTEEDAAVLSPSSTASCVSGAELRLTRLGLAYLGLLDAPSASGALSVGWVDHDPAWAAEAAATAATAAAAMADCSLPFYPVAAPLAGDDNATSITLTSYSAALAAVRAVAGAGSGVPLASRVLAQTLMHPARDGCPSELRAVSGDGSVWKQGGANGGKEGEGTAVEAAPADGGLLATLVSLVRRGTRAVTATGTAVLDQLMGTAGVATPATAALTAGGEGSADGSAGDEVASATSLAQRFTRGLASVIRSLLGVVRQALTSLQAATADDDEAAQAKAGKLDNHLALEAANSNALQRDLSAAFTLFAAAAARGDGAAWYELSNLVALAGVGTQNEDDEDGGSGKSTEAWHPLLPHGGDTAFALGLLHLAAAAGDARAWAALGRRYESGEGGWQSLTVSSSGTSTPLPPATAAKHAVALLAASLPRPTLTNALAAAGHHRQAPLAAAAAAAMHPAMTLPPLRFPASLDTAAFFYEWAADAAEASFTARGNQPFHEAQRLSVDAADSGTVEVAQRGEDDELIRLQRMRADEGDIQAAMAMADLLYWGGRGVQRDQAAALRYWRQAAEAGNVDAAAAVGGMLLRGEGVAEANYTAALEWYERAAAANHTRALNGLGFVYFSGRPGVPADPARAFGYFERAAAIGTDGDSLYNAGFCLRGGTGTARNLTRATGLYETAARRFGHFGAVVTLGRMHAHGDMPGAPVTVKRKKSVVATGGSEGKEDTAGASSVAADEVNSGGGRQRKLVRRRRAPVPAAGEEEEPRLQHIDAVPANDEAAMLLVPRDVAARGDEAAAAGEGLPPPELRARLDGEAAPLQGGEGDGGGGHGGAGAVPPGVVAGVVSGSGTGRRGGRSGGLTVNTTAPGEGEADDDEGWEWVEKDEAEAEAPQPQTAQEEEEEDEVQDASPSGVRNAAAALAYLVPASRQGPWGSLLRRGFDRYLGRDHAGALLHYLHAWALGYETGAANAAYLLSRRLAGWPGEAAGATTPSSSASSSAGAWASRLLYGYSLASGATDARLPLAEALLYGRGGARRDVPAGMALLARASADGSPTAAFTLGELYESGVPAAALAPDAARAERYYRRALELSPPGLATTPVYLALGRLQLKAAADDVLLRWTGASLSEWLGEEGEATVAGGERLASPWEAAAQPPLRRGLSSRLFDALVGDAAPNAAFESGGSASSRLWGALSSRLPHLPSDWETPALLACVGTLVAVLALRAACRRRSAANAARDAAIAQAVAAAAQG